MWPGLLLSLVRALRGRAVTYTTASPTSPLVAGANCIQFQPGTADADLTMGKILPASASVLCLGSGVLVYAPLSPLPSPASGDLALSVTAGQELAIEATVIRKSSTISADGNGAYFTVFYPAPGAVGSNP